MGISLAKIQATRQAEAKDAELQREVETKRAEMELERRRATDLVSARIAKESAQQKADATFYSDTKGADGKLYKERIDAEAAAYRVMKEVEADFFRATKEAEAAFYTKKKEAEATIEMAKAYGHLSDVLGGPQGLLQYMMLQDGTYEKLALANAKAIHGLAPKISVWNTGESSATADSTAPIRNLLQSLPPLLSTINDQTGIAPPSWLATLAAGGGGAADSAGTSQALIVSDGTTANKQQQQAALTNGGIKGKA